MHQDIPILGARVVAPDVRLRFERKLKVDFPTRESWDSRSVTSREGVQICVHRRLKVWGSYRISVWGVYRQDTNNRAYFSLGGWTTIFQAELFAILEVTASKEVTEGREGVIYYDSQAVLKALCSARMGLIQECWDALNKVAEQKQENLVWMPVHMRFAGNERADLLARLRSSESPITAEPHIGLNNRQVASALSDWELVPQRRGERRKGADKPRN